MVKNWKSFNVSEFIVEKAIIPEADFVKEELNKNKQRILNCKTDLAVDDVFNDIFNEHWVLFQMSDLDTESCLSPEWAIHSGFDTPTEKSDIGSIVVITLGKEFTKILSENAATKWDNFCNTMESIIGHEFVHVYQIKKIPKEKHEHEFRQRDDNKAYISSKHEIMAYAFQAVKEFISNGFTPNDIIEKIKKPFNILPESSHSFFQYIYYFKASDPELKRFLKLIYQYCQIFH